MTEIEKLAEEVHNSWWEEKKKQGFHSPFECQSDNHKSYQNSDWKIQDRFDDHFNEKTYKWCDKCHPDMYPYSELSENVKEYDRVTVRTVLAAQEKLKAASSNTVAPVRWVKASERQPNNKDDRPLKVNDGFVIGWFDEDRKLWITDFDITYHSDEVEWLEEQTNPVDNIVESEEKKVVNVLRNLPEDMIVEFANQCLQYPNEARANLWEETIDRWFTPVK